MTRHRDLLESDLLASRLAIFTDAERVIADPVVRNRGTIGGALCQADPSEDLVAVCAAVGAQMVIRGLGRRSRARDARVLPGPVPHGGGRRRDARRDPRPAHRAIGQRLREGRSPRRRLGRRRRGRVDHARATATIAEAGIALAAVGAEVTCAEAEAALVGSRPPTSCSRRPHAPRGSLRPGRPTSAVRRSTSATSPAS